MAAPEVETKVRVVPAKRSASFGVVVGGEGKGKPMKLTASVNVKSITFIYGSDIPKTLEAAEALIALATAVRDELIEEGVTQ